MSLVCSNGRSKSGDVFFLDPSACHFESVIFVWQIGPIVRLTTRGRYLVSEECLVSSHVFSRFVFFSSLLSLSRSLLVSLSPLLLVSFSLFLFFSFTPCLLFSFSRFLLFSFLIPESQAFGLVTICQSGVANARDD